MEGVLDYADIMIQLVEKMRTKIYDNSNLKQMKKEYDEQKRTMDLYAKTVIPQQKRVCSRKRSVFVKCVGILENIIETNGEGFVESGDMKKNILQTQLEALGRSGITTIMEGEFVKYKEDYEYELAKTQYRPAISTLSRALLEKIKEEIASIDSLLDRADALVIQLQATTIPDRTFMTRAEQAAARAEAARQRRAAAAQRRAAAAQKQNTTPDTTTAENNRKRQRQKDSKKRAEAIAKRLKSVDEIVKRLYYRA